MADGKDIPTTLSDLKVNRERIEAKLSAGDYQPGPVRSVSIAKGLRWKTPRGRINALKKLGVKGRSLCIG